MSFLKKRGIETRNTFYLVNTMKIYKRKVKGLKSAKKLADNGVCLPSFPNLNNSQIKYISSQINDYLNRNK